MNDFWSLSKFVVCRKIYLNTKTRKIIIKELIILFLGVLVVIIESGQLAERTRVVFWCFEPNIYKRNDRNEYAPEEMPSAKPYTFNRLTPSDTFWK